MRARPRSATQNGPPPSHPRAANARFPRKVFNCIVDDSALVAGVKRSTRNGIRQWVKNGQIRLFVPLHALDELSRQKGGRNKHADDVRETLQWLDEATTKHPNVVTLQGADETYERWAEVERFAVPRTLFSENDHDLACETYDFTEDTSNLNISDNRARGSVSSGASGMSRSLSPSSVQSMGSSVSPAWPMSPPVWSMSPPLCPMSPPTSPAKPAMSPTKDTASLASIAARPQSSSDSVPHSLQPLFNYILWRIHQEVDPVAALESFIFLCNDPRKVNFARGFDIRTKRLEQLREAVSREDRDFKNRKALSNRENQNLNTATDEQSTAADDETDDETCSPPSPPKAPAAMLQKQLPPNVMDPNAFGRTPPATNSTHLPNGTPKSPRGNHALAHHGSPRAAHVLPFTPGGNVRGHSRGNFRGSLRGRGGRPQQGRGGYQAAPNAQIDPESFARPDPRGGLNGSRGSRKLWVPT